MIPSDIKELPFTPSPYCIGKEHRRVETCKQLRNNPDFREVGTCQHRGCKGKKFYPHIKDTMNHPIVAQGQTTIRRPDRIKESK